MSSWAAEQKWNRVEKGRSPVLVSLYQLFAMVLNDSFATFVTRLTRTSAAAKRKAAETLLVDQF
jgi:hypothetical protein